MSQNATPSPEPSRQIGLPTVLVLVAAVVGMQLTILTYALRRGRDHDEQSLIREAQDRVRQGHVQPAQVVRVDGNTD